MKHDTTGGNMVKLPLIVILSYLIFTEVTYIIMQDDLWEAKFTTVLYASVCYLAMGIGYAAAVMGRRKAPLPVPGTAGFPEGVGASLDEEACARSRSRLVLLFALCTAVTSVYTVLPYYHSFAQAYAFIRDPGQAYEYVKYLNRYGLAEYSQGVVGSVVGITLNILTFTRYLLFVFVISYWKSLRRFAKCVSVLAIAVFIIQTFLIGAMVNIGLVFFSILPALFLLLRRRAAGGPEGRPSSARRWLLPLTVSVALIALLVYFMGTRDVFSLEYSSDNSVFMSGLLGLLYYASHGYTGLSGCLSLPFTFTYGQTAFYGFSSTLRPYLGYADLFQYSYLARNQEATGWSALHVWSTVFPWLASDFSFVLVPVILLLMGVLLGKVWREASETGNPYATVWCGQLFIFFLMIPANNQLFHTFGNSMSTLILLFLYLRSRRRTHSDTAMSRPISRGP